MSEKEISLTTRMAMPSDMDAIYMMGYDVWGDGRPHAKYLEQCHASPKYKKGQWYLLVNNQGTPLSSLITYTLGPDVAGVGSIATPIEFRRRGLATRLIQDVLELMMKDSIRTVFLFSDISPEFYEKLGFNKLPADLQRYPNSVCMVHGTPVAELINTPNFSAPSYF